MSGLHNKGARYYTQLNGLLHPRKSLSIFNNAPSLQENVLQKIKFYKEVKLVNLCGEQFSFFF